MKAFCPELPIVETKPIKNCLTCAHRYAGLSGIATCAATGWHCTIARQNPSSGCDESFSGWEPAPPRRSLAQWIYDTFFRIDNP